jgi:hypothetical protein
MVTAAAVRQVWAALTWSKAALILGDLVPLLAAAAALYPRPTQRVPLCYTY